MEETPLASVEQITPNNNNNNNDEFSSVLHAHALHDDEGSKTSTSSKSEPQKKYVKDFTLGRTLGEGSYGAVILLIPRFSIFI